MSAGWTFGSVASASREKGWKSPGPMAPAVPEVTIHGSVVLCWEAQSSGENGGRIAGEQPEEHCCSVQEPESCGLAALTGV